MRTSGNTVLITGGATGIGYSLARYLRDHDNTVIVCGRREDRLAQAEERLPGISTIRCDVTQPDERAALSRHVADSFPEINVLVNNAGIQCDVDLRHGLGDHDTIAEEISTNLEAPIYLSVLFAPLLSGKDGATIVNVSSGLAFMADRAIGMPVYCATKAGLHAFTLAQRGQLAERGIAVVEMIPPAVVSELNPEGRRRRGATRSLPMMSADDFVDQACDQLARGVEEIRVAVPGRR